MACTLLRIVQAAVNLRRRFECAIQSSFDSVESGDVGEERDQANTEENEQPLPDEEDMNTSEQLSKKFHLSFTEPEEGAEASRPAAEESKLEFNQSVAEASTPGTEETRTPGAEARIPAIEPTIPGVETRILGVETRIPGAETRLPGAESRVTGGETSQPVVEASHQQQPPEDLPPEHGMTFIHSEDSQDAPEVTENGAYKDAPTSSSTEILKENEYSSATRESGARLLPQSTSSIDSPKPADRRIIMAPEAYSTGAIGKIPMVQVNEITGSDRSSTDSDSSSDSRCSVKSVRLRCADADVSPSSGCKPAKLIRSDALETNAEKESSNLQWILVVKESGSELVKEEEDKEGTQEEESQEKDSGGDSNTESEVDKSELRAYSEWLLKGKSLSGSEESQETSGSSDDNYPHVMSSDSDADIVDLDDDDDEDDECGSYLEDEDELMAEASFEESFVDDGFVSLELDEYDDVIIEENEEDLERERMEEEMMDEMRKRFQGAGRSVEQQEHRKLSRQYSPAHYLGPTALPGIPEAKAIREGTAEAKEEGRLRYTQSYRSSRGSKRAVRLPPVQRQRCVLDPADCQDEDEGAGLGQVRSTPRPHTTPTPDHRDALTEADPIRVTTATPSPEVPLVVVATAEGGTRTQALTRTRSRTHPHALPYHQGDPLPRTHTYHKYGSASFDLAKPSVYEGARAAFHTTRSSFEGDRRLSLSTAGGGRTTCDPLPPTTFDKSPGSARRLPPMEAGSRAGSSSSSSDRTVQESVPRSYGVRRSRSERVGRTSAGTSPARSESLRVARTSSAHNDSLRVSRTSPARSESLRVTRSRPHHHDVEMTQLCSPRRFHSYEEYSSRLGVDSVSVPPASVVIETPNEMASSSTPRYPWRVVPPAAADILPSPTEMGSSSAARFAWRSAVGPSGRRQSSLEGGDLEDLMETRRQVEQRRLLLQADSTTPSDEDEEPKSKVRYNDMGSLEQVNEEMADLLDDQTVACTHTQEKIKVQCRALWQLRTTLEEEDPEEQDSDSGRMEVHSSPDRHSPGRVSDIENVTSATSHTTSFESNTDAIVGGEGGEVEGGEVEGGGDGGEGAQEEVTPAPITLPSSEARRTSYRAILANRLKQLDASSRPPLSSENSFDSVDTECSSTTDLSRPEALTTSFDSTTDCPTDSTSDTHSHRLQQMKADSGYRSLEANNSRPPKLSKKQIHFVEDSLEVPETDMERDRSRERYCRDPESFIESLDTVWDPQNKRERLRKGVAQFERRWGKSQAKKRREALRERHASLDTALGAQLSAPIVGVGGSLEGDATTTDELSGKRSVLARFLRTHRYPTAHYRLLQRDYSIDEKSDRLFKEFSRTEVPLEWEPVGRRGTRLYSSRRLHRHLEAEGSPRSHRRKLSPQDSIEEEDQVAAALWEGEVSRPESLAGSIGGEDIPPFTLTEEVE